MSSMTITIGNNKISLNSDMTNNNVNNIINGFENYVIRGCELSVLLVDNDTLDFHKYVFDYLSSSKLGPKKWLLNNIIYSIQQEPAFTHIGYKLRGEYDRLKD
jgi:hypothetical protein